MKKSSNEVIEIIRKAENTKFWGEITIRFKEGQPVLVTRQEQIAINQSSIMEGLSRKNHRHSYDSKDSHGKCRGKSNETL